MSTQHLTNAANGVTSPEFRFHGVHQDHVVQVDGANFDGGSVVLESSFDGGTTWTAVSGGTWTSGEVRTVEYIPQRCRFRTFGGGASMDVSAWTEAGGYRG